MPGTTQRYAVVSDSHNVPVEVVPCVIRNMLVLREATFVGYLDQVCGPVRNFSWTQKKIADFVCTMESLAAKHE
jgi:hypothetical protein